MDKLIAAIIEAGEAEAKRAHPNAWYKMCGITAFARGITAYLRENFEAVECVALPAERIPTESLWPPGYVGRAVVALVPKPKPTAQAEAVAFLRSLGAEGARHADAMEKEAGA